MRAYVIEESIRFEPGENLLTALDTNESIQLSLIASRLLEQLLLAKGQVLSREEIFSTTFDAWGAASTNNNLNQYVLALRKQIHYLGLHEEVIKTVPRIGFTVPEYILLEATDKAIVGSAPAQTPITIDGKMSFWTKNKWSLGYLLFLILLSIGIAVDYLYAIREAVSWNDIEITTPLKIAGPDGCDYFILPGSPPEDRDFYRRLLPPLKGMQCDQRGKSRFFFSLKTSPYHQQRLFIMRCEGTPFNPACFSQYSSREGDK